MCVKRIGGPQSVYIMLLAVMVQLKPNICTLIAHSQLAKKSTYVVLLEALHSSEACLANEAKSSTFGHNIHKKKLGEILYR